MINHDKPSDDLCEAIQLYLRSLAAANSNQSELHIYIYIFIILYNIICLYIYIYTPFLGQQKTIPDLASGCILADILPWSFWGWADSTRLPSPVRLNSKRSDLRCWIEIMDHWTDEVHRCL